MGPAGMLGQDRNSKLVRAVFGDWFFTEKTAAENFRTGANPTGIIKAS
jgi:hypothetical protein